MSSEIISPFQCILCPWYLVLYRILNLIRPRPWSFCRYFQRLEPINSRLKYTFLCTRTFRSLLFIRPRPRNFIYLKKFFSFLCLKNWTLFLGNCLCRTCRQRPLWVASRSWLEQIMLKWLVLESGFTWYKVLSFNFLRVRLGKRS